ncbi:MAG: Invasion protein B, involved in pathogenesis [Saliniramus fredricksonii]|uniref:Invasion protein B, involved in pathogenesis n=1 Tax=Saliniramus fredricksonii TaxID=1653334 RepID=A0A0P7X7Q5_9HYPH|nr:invasion associated locus B family protein [Saliniramus fredricksonii]KPQ11169.1 MAG: Invasion protein B, involved in pathogenesis [Saliniramus fredricksonii]SCC81699.1 Invasion protein IalB, involved in pathogenesis [Saliniramus fredricksonii]
MAFSTRPAKMRTSLGLVAALAIAGFAFAPGAALAQTPPPEPAPGGQGQAPMAPAPTQDGGPVTVPVVPEPSQTEWTKVCGTDPATEAEICYTTRDFVSEDGEPLMAVAVYDIEGGDPDEPNQVVRMLMPLGLLLQPGIRFAADQNRPTNGSYAICFPNGCFAEANIDGDVVDQFKAGETLNVSVQNQVGQVVTFAVPLEGFTAGFEGDPIDPQELEEQQRRLQEELQRRSDEMRERLQQQAQ